MIWFSKPLLETNRRFKHFFSLTGAISPNRRVVKHQKRSQFQTFQTFQTFHRYAPFQSFKSFEELKARKKQFERFGNSRNGYHRYPPWFRGAMHRVVEQGGTYALRESSEA